ncbi:hypothetical protein AKJ16_DCAP15401, partial [Drosera capensis]
MEQKGLLLSALSVGVGVGVGLGLASGKSVGKWVGSNSESDGVTAEQIEQELFTQVVDGRDRAVTFDEFPYYLSEQTRVLLTSAAYVHLKHFEVSKFTRNLSPGSRAILLSGPAESYQKKLAEALANYFEAKLLLLDVADFSLKGFKRSVSEMTLEKMSGLFGSLSILSPKDESVGLNLSASNS